MAGQKTVKAKGKAGKAADGVFSTLKWWITGGAGKEAGSRLGDGLINMHKKKKK